MDDLTLATNGLIVYLAIVAAAVLCLYAAVRAKTWFGFISALLAVVVGGIVIVLWAVYR